MKNSMVVSGVSELLLSGSAKRHSEIKPKLEKAVSITKGIDICYEKDEESNGNIKIAIPYSEQLQAIMSLSDLMISIKLGNKSVIIPNLQCSFSKQESVLHIHGAIKVFKMKDNKDGLYIKEFKA